MYYCIILNGHVQFLFSNMKIFEYLLYILLGFIDETKMNNIFLYLHHFCHASHGKKLTVHTFFSLRKYNFIIFITNSVFITQRFYCHVVFFF